MQETTLRLSRRRALLSELLDLLLRLIQSHLLQQNGLGQNIKRVRARSDGPPDQFVCIAIDLRCGRVPDSFGQSVNQLLFLFGHMASLSLHGTKSSSRPFPCVFYSGLFTDLQ